MKILDILSTAESNLKRAKVRTFLTVLAVFIGTFTLTMTFSFTEGVKQYVNIQLHAYGEMNSVAITPKDNVKESTGSVGLTQSDVKAVESVPNITAVYPDYTLSINYIKYNNAKIGGDVTSLFPGIKPNLAAGSLVSTDDISSIIISNDMLTELGFSNPQDAIGKDVTLNLSGPNLNKTSITKGLPEIIKKDVVLKISGVTVESLHGMPGFISDNLAKQLYLFQHGNTDGFGSIYATSADNLSTDQLNTIKDTLSQKGYNAVTFQDRISRFNQVISLVQIGAGAFAGISLLVACICIINTLLMSVLERTNEIGLLKALGMKRKEIFYIFAVEAASIGFWGGVFGVGFGIALGPILNRLLNHFVANLQGISLLVYPPVIMISIILGGTIIGLLSGVIPAIRASKLDPIVALRHE